MSILPFGPTDPSPQRRRELQLLSEIVNSLYRGGWLVRTAPGRWELRIVPSPGRYFGGGYFSAQYFTRKYF